MTGKRAVSHALASVAAVAFSGVMLVHFPGCGATPASSPEKPVAKTRTIKNPLIDEPGMSDPHMLVDNGVCYLFTGHDVGTGKAEWVMPDWRIYRSKDLQSWELVGTILPEQTYMGKGSTSCWAGDIVKRNGKYYWYFSNRDKDLGVMVADKPEGPYKDALGKPLVTSYDPTIFVDDDNTPFMIWGNGTYNIARLKDSMIELAEEPRKITLNRTGNFPVVDKNSVHKHNGIYYLSVSGYYATSKSVYGPYDTKGVVGKGWGLDTGWAHGDFFVWQGDWYHVWCKYKNRDYDKVRDCFIAPTSFDAEGLMHDDLSRVDAKFK
jgi:arabinoxylan arabinofuranohydrolase